MTPKVMVMTGNSIAQLTGEVWAWEIVLLLIASKGNFTTVHANCEAKLRICESLLNAGKSNSRARFHRRIESFIKGKVLSIIVREKIVRKLKFHRCLPIRSTRLDIIKKKNTVSAFTYFHRRCIHVYQIWKTIELTMPVARNIDSFI